MKSNDDITIQLLPNSAQLPASGRLGTSLNVLPAASTAATANNSNASLSQVNNNNVRLAPNSTASCYQVIKSFLFFNKIFFFRLVL